MFNLLQHVRLSIRLVNLNHPRGLVDGGGIIILAERFIGQCQDIGLTRLGFHAQVEVPRIVPAADIQSRYRVTRVEPRKGRVTLHIAVDVVEVDGSHPGVIHVTEIMPHTIFLIHPHVAHLHRQEILQHRLPDASFINITCYAKNRRT